MNKLKGQPHADAVPIDKLNGIDLRRAYKALIEGYIEACLQGRVKPAAEFGLADEESGGLTKGNNE